MKEYLKWLRGQKMWMFILASQALVVALPTNHRIQYAFIVFWAILASLYNHLSDSWRDMCYIEREVSEQWRKAFKKATNYVLNKQNPQNS